MVRLPLTDTATARTTVNAPNDPDTMSADAEASAEPQPQKSSRRYLFWYLPALFVTLTIVNYALPSGYLAVAFWLSVLALIVLVHLAILLYRRRRSHREASAAVGVSSDSDAQTPPPSEMGDLLRYLPGTVLILWAVVVSFWISPGSEAAFWLGAPVLLAMLVLCINVLRRRNTNHVDQPQG